jgi:hypothetical protein
MLQSIIGLQECVESIVMLTDDMRGFISIGVFLLILGFPFQLLYYYNHCILYSYVSILVKALRYKPEGRGFDFR